MNTIPKILLSSVCLFLCAAVKPQVSNNDYNKGAINVSLPKTPESAGFEKYGSIPVSELTGSPNISVPLYTLKSQFLEVPITLTYSPGIKVTQEATWVGLGFDLITGGRITVETRGCIDEQGANLFSTSVLKTGIQKLYNRVGSSSSLGLLTFATTCKDCDTSITHDVPDDWYSVNGMAQYGLGEPDIYNANFMGYSFRFFFDKLTDSLRFLGERNLFNISLTRNINQQITDWTITDNVGNQYFFYQKETTTLTLPPLGPLQNNTSTSAWLLTKILHPTGDSVVFTYTNYGSSYPVSDWSASLTFMDYDRTLTQSQDNEQNSVILQPAYLTKIESNDFAIDFILGSREDIKGAGSKRLNEIRVRDKLTNTVRKKASFGYGYFDASLSGTCYASQHDSITKYYRLRLQLDSLTVRDSTSLEPPYKFYYYNGAITPHKKSFGQDHWGFYNGGGGTYSDPCSPKNLIPNTGLGTTLNYSAMNGYALSRECVPSYMPSMTMDKIVYPTGGSTTFIYEPHSSDIAVGGGLRIKTIRNYSSSLILANSLDYDYQAGTYMGLLGYYRVSYALSVCTGMSPGGNQQKFHLSSNGTANDHNLLVAYSHVKISQRNAIGESNGYVIKLFNVPNPRQTTGGYGFNILGPHWPLVGAGYGITTRLYPAVSGFAPTPPMQLDGKLKDEKYYDNNDNLLKWVSFYYQQAGYSENYYSIKAIDNRIGGASASPSSCGGNGQEFVSDGARRYTLFLSPGKSFFTLTDSVIERIYHGNNYITKKQAFKYNSHYQLEYEINENSDGTQSITYTKTSAEMEPPHYPITPTGDATLVKDLKNAHIYDFPIEHTQIRKTLSGDSLVVRSRVNIFQGALAKKTYILETATPLTLRSQFTPIHYDYPNYPNSPTGSNYTLKLDTKYKLVGTADYNPKGYLSGYHTQQGNSAYIWDEYYGDMLAKCENADSVDIAFTSFESPAAGRWTINAGGVSTDYTSPTGKKCYSLASGNISITGLSTSKAYTVSYWSKNGAQGVNTTTSTAGITIYGWTYYEHLVSNPGSGTITVSGSGTIDEVRLYPKGSLMTTYSYEPLVGLVSQSDVNNRINYFEYDVIGRLSRIRDENKYVLRQYEYKFGDIFNFPYGNQPRSQTFAKNDCASGYAGSQIIYSVPANKYGSFLSVTDANQQADAEIVAYDGQTKINASGTCTPFYNFAVCCGNGSSTNSFVLTGTGSVNFSFNLYGSSGSLHGKVATLTGILFVPGSSKTVTVSAQGNPYQITFSSNGDININGPSYTGAIILSGTYILN
jgi:hypothetical protein